MTTHSKQDITETEDAAFEFNAKNRWDRCGIGRRCSRGGLVIPVVSRSF